MDKEKAKDRVIDAITSSDYRWRTPLGIAKDSGVSHPEVLEVLENSGEFVRARKGSSQGEPLYTTKEKYKENTSLGQRIVSAVTNKLAE